MRLGAIFNNMGEVFLGEPLRGAKRPDLSEQRIRALQPDLPQAQASGVSGNGLMSGNFVGNSGQSKYIQARLGGFETEKQLNNKYFGMVDSLMAQISCAMQEHPRGGYALINRISKRASGMLERDKQEEVVREAKVHLDKSRDDLAEAAVPKDEQGRPIGELGSGAEHLPPAMPEIHAGGGPQSVEPAIAGTDAAVYSQAGSLAPAPAPSLDIVV